MGRDRTDSPMRVTALAQQGGSGERYVGSPRSLLDCLGRASQTQRVGERRHRRFMARARSCFRDDPVLRSGSCPAAPVVRFGVAPRRRRAPAFNGEREPKGKVGVIAVRLASF